MTDFKIATWNLYQFAAPGTFWYENDKDSGYAPEDWDAKQAWMRAILRDMDADVIGCQEVFSVDAFRALMQENGYAHVAVVADPATDPDDPAVFRGPVNGIASRYPFAEPPAALSIPHHLRGNLPMVSDFAPRRAILRARIDVPGIGVTTIYVCHFKSQGASVDPDYVAAQPDWKTRFRAHLRANAAKDAEQIVRRSVEAAMVYLAAMEEVEADPQAPVIVLGDLNDTPGSAPLRIATQQEWIEEIGDRHWSDLEPTEKAWTYTWQLFDSYSLPSNQSPAARAPTHAGSFDYPASTFDYILVSNGLNQNNPRGVAEVTEHRVYDAHLPDNDPLRTSDHAPVRVTLRPRA